MNKRTFLEAMSFDFYNKEEFNKKIEFYKEVFKENVEDITYDDYLEAFKKTYEMIKYDYNQLLIKLTKLNKWLTDEYSEQTYTVEEIQSVIREFGLDTDGFNGEIKVDE